jgi:signal transduction histidine kinase/ligand-binding sensor domain-containing protein
VSVVPKFLLIRSILLTICCLLLLNKTVTAQFNSNPDPVLLPNNQEIGRINAIHKDNIGYIWIGSESGLYRYDSKNVVGANEIFKTNEFADLIYDIKEDANKNLWVSAYGGLFCIDPDKYSYKKIYPDHHPDSSRFKNQETAHLLIQGETIWMTTHFGLESYNIQNKSWTQYPIYDFLGLKEYQHTSTNIIADRENNLWLGTINGLCRFNTVSKKMNRVDLQNEPEILDNMENCITNIELINDSLMIVCTWGSGVKTYNIHTGAIITHLFEENSNLGINNIAFSILQPDNKSPLIYIGTAKKGLLTFNFMTHELKNNIYFLTESEFKSLSVTTLYLDYDGIFWIGTTKGLQFSDISTSKIQYINITNSLPEKTSTGITSIVEDSSHQVLYMGIYSNLLLKYTIKEKKISYYDLKEAGVIVSMYLLGNELFLSCRNGNYIFNTATEEIKADLYLPAYKFQNYYRINDSILWCTSYLKPTISFNSKSKKYGFIGQGKKSNTAGNNDIMSVYIDKSKTIWVSTFRHGLGVYNTATDEIEFKIDKYQNLPIYDIHSISSDSLGNIWFGTAHMGLFSYNLTTKKIENFRSFGGIQINSTYAICKSSENIFWLGTNNGLIRFDPITKQSRPYTTADGLITNNLTEGIYTGQNDILYISQLNGIAIADLKSQKNSEFNYPVYINRINVAGKQIEIGKDSSLVLNYDDNSLSIDFALLYFSKPGFNTYSYRLNGYHEDWIQIGNNTRIYLSKIPPGEYQLEIKAANREGQWSKQQIHLNIRILSPFWKTGWFYALIALFLLVVLYLIYRFRIAQINKLLKMRNKIAGDLHDDIGSSLSSIKLYSGYIRNKVSGNTEVSEVISRIENTSKESLENMSDIVWSINPQNDQLEKVVAKMKAFSDNMLNPLGIHIDYNLTTQAETLSMQSRRDLFLFFKEAINNIAKYAKATAVEISLKKEAGTLQLIIRDNGIGFDQQEMGNGNGMHTLRDRAQSLNGKADITSNSEQGTTIKLTFRPT